MKTKHMVYSKIISSTWCSYGSWFW